MAVTGPNGPSRTGLFLLAAMLVVLTFSLIHLFALRFETGDVLPAYSSLRADPLGSKVLYESLDKTGDVEVSRNFSPLKMIDAGPDTTVFILGMDARELRWSGLGSGNELDQLVTHGGRLVLAMYPTFDLNNGPSIQEQEDHDESSEPAKPEEAQDKSKIEPEKNEDQTDEANAGKSDQGRLVGGTLGIQPGRG